MRLTVRITSCNHKTDGERIYAKERPRNKKNGSDENLNNETVAQYGRKFE